MSEQKQPHGPASEIDAKHTIEHMPINEQMEFIYSRIPAEQIPWNCVEPPVLLRDIVEQHLVRPCKTIDLGCGLGNYAFFFARNGFDVTGVDLSETAIQAARKKAASLGITCRFVALDLLAKRVGISETFDFAYDYELLHHIFPDQRAQYARNVAQLLNPGALYLSVSFSEQNTQFGPGKYRKTPLGTCLYFSSEAEITSLFGPLFDIEQVGTVDIAGKYAPHKAVCALMRNR